MAEPAKRQPTKKQPTKKQPTKKQPASSARTAAPRASARPARSERDGVPTGVQAAVRGAQQLVELTGKEFEGIVGVAKGDGGWSVQVEVLEMRRIPSTTDVLAVYEVDLDGDGDLVGYRRADRYVRGSAGEERS